MADQLRDLLTRIVSRERHRGTVLLDAEELCAIETALAEPVQQTCNCRWVGDVQTQQCTMHEAHVAAIHEWAERAKAAEKKLAALAQAEPVQRTPVTDPFNCPRCGRHDYGLHGRKCPTCDAPQQDKPVQQRIESLAQRLRVKGYEAEDAGSAVENIKESSNG